MFSFWVNNSFADKQVLLDICGLMHICGICGL